VWATLRNRQKKQKIYLSGLEPTINYYKVESKLYFLDEKNILLYCHVAIIHILMYRGL
jgi:hypothetical protein